MSLVSPVLGCSGKWLTGDIKDQSNVQDGAVTHKEMESYMIVPSFNDYICYLHLPSCINMQLLQVYQVYEDLNLHVL